MASVVSNDPPRSDLLICFAVMESLRLFVVRYWLSCFILMIAAMRVIPFLRNSWVLTLPLLFRRLDKFVCLFYDVVTSALALTIFQLVSLSGLALLALACFLNVERRIPP